MVTNFPSLFGCGLTADDRPAGHPGAHAQGVFQKRTVNMAFFILCSVSCTDQSSCAQCFEVEVVVPAGDGLLTRGIVHYNNAISQRMDH